MRVSADTPLVRDHVPLRALVFGSERRRTELARRTESPIAVEEALRLERVLDELRAHRSVDDLVEWIVRGRPRSDEITGERLSLASVRPAYAMLPVERSLRVVHAT
jgi:hypothetical protein